MLNVYTIVKVWCRCFNIYSIFYRLSLMYYSRLEVKNITLIGNNFCKISSAIVKFDNHLTRYYYSTLIFLPMQLQPPFTTSL